MPKLSRRSLIGSSVVAGVAAIPALQTLAALPPDIPLSSNDGALNELAEIRRLITELIAIDDEVAAAQEVQDVKREAAAEARNDLVYARFREPAADIQAKRPRGWLDVVARAEIAAFSVIWKNSRSDWEQLSALIDREECDWARADAALAISVLWLAEREGGNAHA